MAFAKLLSLVLVAAIIVQEICSHGMMLNPINRSSAWRKGFPVEPNYTDNEHFCGGQAIQHGQNGGKCGECGDDYSLSRPRPNENGGYYGTGVIVKDIRKVEYNYGKYKNVALIWYEMGAVINVTVRLTASHLGYFEFSLCPLKSSKEPETEECFNQHRLAMADGSGYRYPIPTLEKKDYFANVVLPKDLTCKHCVFRWHYNAGNTWGICENGKGRPGCGPQENFRSCADISILKAGSLAGLDVPEVPAEAFENL